jgi:hypothetical protein
MTTTSSDLIHWPAPNVRKSRDSTAAAWTAIGVETRTFYSRVQVNELDADESAWYLCWEKPDQYILLIFLRMKVAAQTGARTRNLRKHRLALNTFEPDRHS